MRGTSRIAVVVSLLLAIAGAARAQRSHFGIHGGYNFDADDPLIGAQLLLPVASHLELYPSFDYYFTGATSTLGLSVDLKLRTHGTRTVLYGGGGLNILWEDAGAGTRSSDTGGDLFGGLESRRGNTHPYIELKLLLHDSTSLQLAAGLNFTLF